MALPIERFKNSYSNHRWNPFTGTYMLVDKTEDNLYIPASSPFLIQLLELPKKEVPSTVTVWCYNTSSYFTEVLTPPAQSQFRVDYPPADGYGTGLIEFNQNDTGKQVRIFYRATGSPILEEFLNTKTSWPAGTPTDRQIAAYLASTQMFVWRDNPIRYFHEDDVVYHSSGEFESCMLFRFKKAAAEGKVLLELKGAKLHQAYYTEMKLHNHGEGSLVISGNTGNDDANHGHPLDAGGIEHRHQYGSIEQSVLTGPVYNFTGAGTGIQDASHKHPAGTLAISGDTANTGGNPKTYPNALKIYVDSIDRTASFLSKSGLSALGDGTSSHAFVTTGSGEVDVSDWFPDNKIYEIKITEPQNAGGRCLLHLELS